MKYFLSAGLVWLCGTCLLVSPQAYAAAKEEQIVVRLSTDQPQLLPLYIAPFINAAAGFSAEYIAELEKVLLFDIGHNGSTYLVPQTAERRQLTKDFDAFPHEMRKEKIFHILKVRIQKQQLSAHLFLLQANGVKTIENLKLTGDLAADRTQIHQLADTIHRVLFASEGIASTHILYTRKHQQAGKWLSEVWEADYDGANRRKLSQPDSGYCVTPLYLPPSPKSRSGAYFYVSYKCGQPKIYLAAFKDRLERRFISLKGSQIMPAISKQRDKVAFISDASGNPDLFLQPFNVETGAIGKPRQIYANYGATQGSPTFSPDGKSIAFVSNKDGSIRIYVMEIPAPDKKLKEIKPRLISRANQESSAPVWSPDGTKLAYCARSGRERQIWIYEFNADREWQLTKSPHNKENPSWAPNSLHVVFNTTNTNPTELYMINLIQQKEVHIPSVPGDKRFPAWEPL